MRIAWPLLMVRVVARLTALTCCQPSSVTISAEVRRAGCQWLTLRHSTAWPGAAAASSALSSWLKRLRTATVSCSVLRGGGAGFVGWQGLGFDQVEAVEADQVGVGLGGRGPGRGQQLDQH